MQEYADYINFFSLKISLQYFTTIFLHVNFLVFYLRTSHQNILYQGFLYNLSKISDPHANSKESEERMNN